MTAKIQIPRTEKTRMQAVEKAIVGRKVVSVEWQTFKEKGQVWHEPLLLLDNGDGIYFAGHPNGALNMNTISTLSKNLGEDWKPEKPGRRRVSARTKARSRRRR